MIKTCPMCGRKYATHLNAEICHLCRKAIGTPCHGCSFEKDCRWLIRNKVKQDPYCYYDNPFRGMFIEKYRGDVGTRGVIARQLERWDKLSRKGRLTVMELENE